MRWKELIILAIGLTLLAQMAQADWTSAQRITWTSAASRNPAIAVDSGGQVHVVWYDHAIGSSAVYYKRSTDGGATWGSAQRMSWVSDDSYFPAIVVDKADAIHVVWYDDPSGNQEIYYRRSKDGGATWTEAQRLTWTSGDSYYPVLAIDSNNYIHLVWQDSTPIWPEIYYKQSKDGGGIWSYSKRLTWTLDSYYRPAVTIDSADAIHIVWYCDVSGNDEFYYKRSLDAGTNWSGSRRLTWTAGQSVEPGIAADPNNNVHLVWSDNTPGNDEVYYKSSLDEGETWEAAKRLSWTAENSRKPEIAIDSLGHIHVVWDERSVGFPEIFYRQSTDHGGTWSAAQRLTWTARYSVSPALAIDANDIIHLVWEDDTPLNLEIYYKNGNE